MRFRRSIAPFAAFFLVLVVSVVSVSARAQDVRAVDAGIDASVELDGGVPRERGAVAPTPAAEDARLPPSSPGPDLLPELGLAPDASEFVTVILGLVVVLALAYVGGHPRVRAIEERLRISHVVTAGFPFVVLGVVARDPRVGILSDATLDQVRPILPLGLGWIGFALGFRFDARGIDRPPRRLGLTLGLTAAAPFLVTLGASAVFLRFAGEPAEYVFIRLGLILALASTISGSSAPVLGTAALDWVGQDRLTRTIQFEQLIAVVGLGLVGAFFRPGASAVAWQLPAVAWVFVTLGQSAVLGLTTYAALAIVRTKAEVTLVMLGAIAFSAGMASYLRLSPTVVCFSVALLLANVPGSFHEHVRETLDRLEGPIYLLFLFLAGAHWQIADPRGWLLLVLFVVARVMGKSIGVAILGRTVGDEVSTEERRALAFSPMGALAVATAISAQDLYPGVAASWVVTAVIGGAIVNEIIVQAFGRRPVASISSERA